jgi:hypothetical protein
MPASANTGQWIKEAALEMNRDSRRRAGLLRTAEEVDRPEFLVAAASLASAGLVAKTAAGETSAAPNLSPGSAKTPERLGVDGGSPVRPTRLKANSPGPLYYDDEERRKLLDVLDPPRALSLVRYRSEGWFGPTSATVREGVRAHQGTRCCAAVTSGTAAPFTSVATPGAGPGEPSCCASSVKS